MAGSPTHRGLVWLTCGVLSTVAAAVVDALTNNLTTALLVGALIALIMGISINPTVNALKSKSLGGRQSVGTTARSEPISDGVDTGKATYRGEQHPRFPLQHNHHNQGGERA